jgi:hypothetical protein
MVAKINAKKANQAAEPGFPLLKAVLEKIRAPTTVIPEMAFAPDIRGVCSVAGTFVISSNPKKIAKIKIVIAPIKLSNSIISLPPLI